MSQLEGVHSARELHRRGGRIRPVHGQVFVAACPRAGGFRDDQGGSASPRRRLRPRRTHRRAGHQGPLARRGRAAPGLDPGPEEESQLAGVREGHLGLLFRTAGLRDVEEGVLSVDVYHPSFEEWWEPFTLGVGPAGAYVAGLDAKRQTELRELCRELLPDAPFVLTARAWAARGLV